MNRIGGLRPTKKDTRDFNLGAWVKLPLLVDLPSEFSLYPISIKDQKDTDFCSAFATCYMSEIQEGTPLSPEWSFAVSKKLSGDPDGWGQNIRDALAVHTKYGGVETSEAPFSLENKQDSFLRRIENWPIELFPKAEKHRKQSYFKVTGQYDAFDNIRASLWRYHDEKRAVGFGVNWSWGNDPVIPIEFGNGFGHMICTIGWKQVNNEPRLIIRNSYGGSVGDRGNFYFPREVINHYVRQYGAYMFIDEDPDTVKKEQWGLWQRLVAALKKLLWPTQ